MKIQLRQITTAALASAFLVLGLSACSTTSQTRKVQTSGFLNDYSQLRHGKEDESLLIYVNPAARWKNYTKIQLDPIQLWYAGDYDLGEVPQDELQALVDHLHAAIRAELGSSYTFVSQGGPDVMRLRVAITEAKRTSVPANVVSTVVPQVKLISGAKKLATGTHLFVGRAAVEDEILDGVTGERLAAIVDERGGNKTLRGVTSAWSDVEEACNHWAKRLSTRLAKARAE